MWRALALVWVMGCGGGPGEPDAVLPADAEPRQVYAYCEAMNQYPDCHGEPCAEGGVQECGTDRLCQQWDDLDQDAGTGCDCFQCRYLFWCQCVR